MGGLTANTSHAYPAASRMSCHVPGRVPGHFCGCVGIKPTVGRFSTTGVVPACRSLDCPSVFARCVEDGAEVARLMQARISCLHAFRLTLCRNCVPTGGPRI